MAILNRILNIFILLAAVGALVFGIMLSNHRQAARDRGDKYAETLAQVVEAQDADSGTNVKAKVSADNLRWNKFEKERSTVDDALSAAVNQSKGTIKQRNELAEGVANVGATLGAEVSQASLKSVSEYSEALADVEKRATAVKARDEAFTSKVLEVAEKVKANVDAESLKDMSKYEGELANFGADVDKMALSKKRIESTLSQVVAKADPDGNIGLTPELIADAPQDKLIALGKTIDNLQEAAAERDTLRRDKIRLEQTRDDLNGQVNVLTSKVTDLEEKLRNKNDVIVGPKEDPNAGPTPATFEGAIVDVNYDLNYVIIDLGGEDKLPQNITLSVVRDREFITDIAVTTVYKEYSVADIMPELMEGKVIPGDKVVYFAGK